ncbi:GTP 3',8-cyclase MoaA [Rhodococcus opacus]|uniref:GTP 3',8-cyclase n=1 Tax=Rhodococcus opacus TaxID=37919 RepID=A0A2S8IZ19_RHOOP|nr:GTP 3',8-cyclase MoaA [Rhodococcus opacus]PQP20044.1 GTP 3',8-cyclase MoaA [Rhodococcus opacus]
MALYLGLPKRRTRADSVAGSLPPAPVDRNTVPAAGLVDRYGRRATDLRVSLIDKCNLRCTYCMPAEGLPWLPKQAVMSAEEVLRIVRLGVDILGVREVRLTGGEPLVRADLLEIIEIIRTAFPTLPISMTTNAVGLEEKAEGLKSAGLTRINVSLDSLHEETFRALTRRPFLGQVLAGVEAAAAAGLGPIKINAVLMRGINDVESPGLLAWALERGFELRFIEQMPLDADHGWTRREMITASEIRELLSMEYVLTPDPRARDGAPAERFEVKARLPGNGPVLGSVGIIASVTEPFCRDCRRTRITAEGRVMSCLFSREDVDLLGPLRDGASDELLGRLWQEAMWVKPRAHGMDHAGLDTPQFVQPDRNMSAIGG